MNILLDECCPDTLARFLLGHTVETIKRMGWKGTKNGRLIQLADPLFDVFITVDKNLAYQQNLHRLRMAIILLDTHRNSMAAISPLLPELLQLLSVNLASGYYTVTRQS